MHACFPGSGKPEKTIPFYEGIELVPNRRTVRTPQAKMVRKVMDGGRTRVWVGIDIVNPVQSVRVGYRGKTALSKIPDGSKLNGENEMKLTHTERSWLDENREVVE